MNVTFAVNQRLALAQGINAPQPTVTIDIDPSTLTEEQRNSIAARLNPHMQVCGRDDEGYFSDGSSRYNEPRNEAANPPHRIPLVTAIAPTLDGLLAAIAAEEQAIVAAAAKKTADKATETERKRAATQQVLDERKTITTNRYVEANYTGAYQAIVPHWPYEPDSDVVSSPEATAWLAELEAANDVTRSQIEAELAAARAAKQRKIEDIEARESAKKQFRAEYIIEHGTDDQKERLAEGVLPVSEIMTLINRDALAALDGLPRLEYPDLNCSDEQCGSDDDDESCDVTYDSELVGKPGLTPEQFAAVKAIRQVMPAKSVFTYRKFTTVHSCDHNDGCAKRSIIGVRLTVPYGPFEFNADLAL